MLDEEPLVEPPLLDLAEWISGHYLAPPGECFKLVLPPSGVRASRAVVRLAPPGPRPGAGAGAAALDRPGDGGGDPVLAALRDGPLRLSTLARRLGRDPQAALARLRQAGVVEVSQDLAGTRVPRGAGGRAHGRRGEAEGSRAGRAARPCRGGGRARARGRPRARPAVAARRRRPTRRARLRCASRPSATHAARRGSPPSTRWPWSRQPISSGRCVRSKRPSATAASARSSSTASPAAARPRSTCGRSRRRSSATAAPSSSCPRSDSRRCSCARPARASPASSPCCTASCRPGNATTSGGARARARPAWSSARARRCSRRCRGRG